MAAKIKNYAEVFWPQWCRKNRPFLTEEQIVVDLVTKIRGSRTSLMWWTNIETEDLNTYIKNHKNLIANYYNLGSPRNIHFNKSTDTLDVIQLRILQQVWTYLNREIYNHEIESQPDGTTERDVEGGRKTPT